MVNQDQNTMLNQIVMILGSIFLPPMLSISFLKLNWINNGSIC